MKHQITIEGDLLMVEVNEQVSYLWAVINKIVADGESITLVKTGEPVDIVPWNIDKYPVEVHMRTDDAELVYEWGDDAEFDPMKLQYFNVSRDTLKCLKEGAYRKKFKVASQIKYDGKDVICYEAADYDINDGWTIDFEETEDGYEEI